MTWPPMIAKDRDPASTFVAPAMRVQIGLPGGTEPPKELGGMSSKGWLFGLLVGWLFGLYKGYG